MSQHRLAGSALSLTCQLSRRQPGLWAHQVNCGKNHLWAPLGSWQTPSTGVVVPRSLFSLWLSLEELSQLLTTLRTLCHLALTIVCLTTRRPTAEGRLLSLWLAKAESHMMLCRGESPLSLQVLFSSCVFSSFNKWTNSIFFMFLKNFYWSIVAFQCCVSAVQQSESVMCIQVSPLVWISCPFGSLQSME